MRVGLVEEEQAVLVTREAEETQHHEELLLALAEFAKSDMPGKIAFPDVDTDIFDQIRDIGALENLEELPRWSLGAEVADLADEPRQCRLIRKEQVDFLDCPLPLYARGDAPVELQRR